MVTGTYGRYFYELDLFNVLYQLTFRMKTYVMMLLTVLLADQPKYHPVILKKMLNLTVSQRSAV
jgi:hypothetical protein